MAELERIRGEGVARDAGAALPARPRAGRGRVVRSLGRAVERPCARPGCSTPAAATLRFAYAEREAMVEPLAGERLPQAYDLCVAHAARTRPPQGWTLRDRRPEDERRPDVPPPTPADLGGDHTVAVLAAALRATPVSEDVVATTAEIGPSGPMQPTQPQPAAPTEQETPPHPTGQATPPHPPEQDAPPHPRAGAAVPEPSRPVAGTAPFDAAPSTSAAGAVQERLLEPPARPAAPATRPPLVVRRQAEAAARPGTAADW